MKKLLVILGVIVALVIAGALIAPHFISAENFKGQIVAQVEQATGRKLEIKGPLSITFFPIVGVSAEDVTLSNRSDFGSSTPFATLKSMKVEVALMPLLSKQIQVQSFELKDPQINLHVNASGVENWNFAKPGTAAPAASEPVAKTSSGGGIPSGFAIGAVNISNGTVSFIDDVKKTRMDIKNLNTNVSLSSMNSPLKFSGSGDWNGKSVKVGFEASSLQALMDKTKADLNIDISSDLISVQSTGALEKDVFAGKANIKSPSLKELIAWLQPGSKPLSTPAALAFNVSSDVKYGNHIITLSGMSLGLDTIQANGGMVINTASSKPDIDVNLSTGKLDFNAFLPPEKQADNSLGLISKAYAAGAPWSTDPIDLAALKAFNLNANIKTEGLKVRKIELGQTPLVLKISNGRLSANVTNAELYSGKGNVTIVADGGTSPASYEMGMSLAGVNAEQFLTAADITDKFSGAANLQLNITSRGASQQQIISALNGSGNLKVDNGTIKGVNIGDMMNNLQSAFQNANNPAQRTAFDDMSGSFTIAQGVISNKDLSMKTSGLNVKGEGQVNLPAYTINYRLTPQMIANVKDKTTGEVSQKGGVAVPLLISGSLDHPTYQPDLAATLQNALQDPKAFKEQLRNSKGDFKEQFKGSKDSVKDLKNMFKGLR